MTLGALARGFATTKMSRDAKKRAEEDRARELEVQYLSHGLDDPNATQDERATIHAKIGELIGESKKQDGMFGLLGRLFHGKEQQKQPENPLAPLLALMQKRNDQPVSQGVTTVPGRMDIQMAAVPGTEERGTESVDATRYIFNKPTRYGEQTNQQLSDRRALDLFSQQQDIKARHDAENDARTKETALARAQVLGENAIKLAQTNNTSRQTRLDDQQLFQLTKERDALYQSYVGSGLDPAAAMSQANAEYIRKYTTLADSREAQAKLAGAQAAAIPARLKLQERALDLREFKTEADVDVAYQRLSKDLTTQQQNQFKTEAGPLFDQLKAVVAAREQVSRSAVTNPYAMSNPSGVQSAVEAFDKRAGEIQDQINAMRGRYASAPTTVPQRPARHGAAQSSAGAEDPQVRAYADRYFKGDYGAAVGAIQAQRRGH